MEILSARPRASTIRCGFVDDAAARAERTHAIVAQLPEPSLWIPCANGLPHPGAHCHVGRGDAYRDDPVVGKARPWRFPIAFGDGELHGLDHFFRWASWRYEVAPRLCRRQPIRDCHARATLREEMTDDVQIRLLLR